ncbi:Uncharacterised protein [Mannheimia haemolytica]|uniref:Smr domain-containing protein n=1 Tax=Mannheimia haemolytica TaxID=75985 RepID=A0A378N4Q5_MANHA|nr:Uncharacterised protein [Mannheimia haemolytica]
MNDTLLDDEFALFREAAKGTKKADTKYLCAKAEPRKKLQELRELKEKADTEFYFSDEYEPLLKEENEKVKYLREDVDPYILKQLRRGDFQTRAVFRSAWFNSRKSEERVAALILACEREKVYCASVMTGFGTRTLKDQIPRWLVQHQK